MRNLDASIAFYREFCGLVVTHDQAMRRQLSGSRSQAGRRSLSSCLWRVSASSASVRLQSSGFAMESREAVDAIAAAAQVAGCLEWAPRQEPYPVGYYCGLKDPDGYFVEFSYGQPLGPGAE